jgi:hypothetical protein
MTDSAFTEVASDMLMPLRISNSRPTTSVVPNTCRAVRSLTTTTGALATVSRPSKPRPRTIGTASVLKIDADAASSGADTYVSALEGTGFVSGRHRRDRCVRGAERHAR